MIEEEEYMDCTPPNLSEIANATLDKLIPSKSRKVYDLAYEKFLKWAREQKTKVYSENVLLAYFSGLSKDLKSSTLWSQYSMLKTELDIKKNVNIGKFTKLTAFLKRKSEGYKPKKSETLTKEQFDFFMDKAPNSIYLAAKIVLLFGMSGALRCDELVQLTINDIEDLGKLLLVKIRESKNKTSRSFTILGEKYLNLYRSYAALRPADMSTARFFIRYKEGTCHKVVMGIHKISSIPKDVATFLKLQNPKNYTGHCLRRSSATWLVDAGGDLASLKRHGGWKSSTVAEGYIDESLANKKQTAERILNPKATCTVTNSNIVDAVNFVNMEDPADTNKENVLIDGNIQKKKIVIEDLELHSVKKLNTVVQTTSTNSSKSNTSEDGFTIKSCQLQNCTFNITINKNQ